jgi:hypothetical protein
MRIRVPLGTSVEICTAPATIAVLQPADRPMTLTEWSTLANVCSAYVQEHGDSFTREFVAALIDKCIARRDAISNGEVMP